MEIDYEGKKKVIIKNKKLVLEQKNMVKKNNRINKNSNVVKKDKVKKDSQKIDNPFNEGSNIIINIEIIKNMIIAIEDSKNDSSIQSYILLRLSSLITSNSNKLLLDKFKTKILYYENKIEKILEELMKKSM